MKKRIKLFTTKATSIDDLNKSVTFTISDNKVDRYGEIVEQKSWDFKSYKNNPIVLWGHDPSQAENVLGTASSLKIAEDGSATTAKLNFDSDINPKAELIFNQIKKGTLRTVSVGFVPHTEEFENDVPVLKNNELLEISVVPIPANPRAIALSVKDGSLHRKDAEFMLDSMRKEADLLEAQLKEDNPTKEKSMTPEQEATMNAILAGQAKLVEKVDLLTTENATLHEELAALKPAEESPEDKVAREAKEAEDAKAEADKKAADEAAKAEAEKNDTAKDGGNDQSGAADEFDENAELTPEQEAELDALIAA